MTSPKPNLEQFSEFCFELCRQLITCGCSSSRLERLIAQMSETFGFQTEVMAMPTGCFFSIKEGKQQKFELVRVKEWQTDLSKLSELSKVVTTVSQGSMDLKEATAELNRIEQKGSPYPRYLTSSTFGCASAALVGIYGGSLIEQVTVAFTGITAGAIHRYFVMDEKRRYLGDFVAAFVVAFLVSISAHFVDIDRARLIVGGIIVLVPGLVFVNALQEIAQKSLISGAAKLTESIAIALNLASGVIGALGSLHFMEKLWNQF